MKTIKFVSFDPASLRNLGWALVTYNEDGDDGASITCSAGTFVAPKFEDKDRYLALWPMFSMVDTFLEKFQPDVVVIEQTSGFKGGFVTGQVSQCMGAILTACGKHQRMVMFVYPSRVKKKVAGNGRATKPQMRKAVEGLLKKLSGLEVKFDSEHAIDATANIISVLIEQGSIEVEDDE